MRKKRNGGGLGNPGSFIYCEGQSEDQGVQKSLTRLLGLSDVYTGVFSFFFFLELFLLHIT